MASRRLCISAGGSDAHPIRPRGPGGGGRQANRRAVGREGGWTGRACRGGRGEATNTCLVVGDSSRLPAGGGRPCTSAEGEGHGPQPCAFSTGRRNALHPCACQHRVEGLGLQPCAHQHRVEGTVGVAPLQPTPAALPIEGLWKCCIAAPGPQHTYRC